jgi:hypothetical protein
MDSVVPEMINRYREEVTQICARLKSEVTHIRSIYNTNGDPTINENVTLTASKNFNCFFNPMVAFGLHGIMNKGLQVRRKIPMNSQELEIVI